MQRKTISFLIKPSFGFRAIMMSTFSPTIPQVTQHKVSTASHTCTPTLRTDPSTPRFPIIFSIFISGSWLKCYSISFVSLLPNLKMQASPNSSCSSLLTTLPFLKELAICIFKIFLLNYNYNIPFPLSSSNPSHIPLLIIFQIHDFFSFIVTYMYVYRPTYTFLNTEIQAACLYNIPCMFQG